MRSLYDVAFTYHSFFQVGYFRYVMILNTWFLQTIFPPVIMPLFLPYPSVVSAFVSLSARSIGKKVLVLSNIKD